MTQDAKTTRPGQATFAGWLIIAGSVILVATAWQRVSSLHTLEVQEELRRMLSEPPLSGTGLSVGGLAETVRVLCMVAAGSATAAAILGFYAMRRSTGARLALTLVAPLVLIGGFATAGFFAPLVVAGVVMLWLSPTRDWFAGRPWVNSLVPPGKSRPPDPFAPQAPAQHRHPDSQQPPESRPAPQPAPPGQTFGSPQGPPPPAPLQQQVWPTSYDAPVPPERGPRPGAVAWACGLVWGCCGLLSGLMVLFSLVFAVAADEMFAEIERQQPGLDYQGLTHDQVVNGIYLMTGLVVLWSVAAMVVAIFAFRGDNWARIALLASSVSAGVVCLAMAIANPLLLLIVVAAAVTTWLLMRSDVVAWFRR